MAKNIVQPGQRRIGHILQHHNFFLNAYKYNYRNPVAAGISSKVEDYKFSTLSGKLKTSPLLVPVVEDINLLTSETKTLEWLNTPPTPEKLEAVRWGLRHQFFKAKKERNTNKPMILDGDTL
nr:hypothetical protein HAGR004_22650 [Bdellovibrio sp. HAGR004]